MRPLVDVTSYPEWADFPLRRYLPAGVIARRFDVEVDGKPLHIFSINHDEEGIGVDMTTDPTDYERELLPALDFLTRQRLERQ